MRDRAAVVALAEVDQSSPRGKSRLNVHRVLAGGARMAAGATLDLTLDMAVKPGGLVLLFGNGLPAAKLDALAWHGVAVNEQSYAYFARAPAAKVPAAERLRYFAPYLEHADPLVAEDAYLEFGHAPFDVVAQAAGVLPAARLRAWLVDAKVPPSRKGFYGLALGLSTDAATREANAEFLRKLVVAPEDDFRGGFDGILGGYLLLAGEPGLELVEKRYLAHPNSRDGDVRHAMTALRFYREYGREIPLARLSVALAKLLDRREFAAAAITDLARWKAWESTARIARLYATADAATRRAVVGYLLACPSKEAVPELQRLRELDAAGVADAERVLSQTTDLPAVQ